MLRKLLLFMSFCDSVHDGFGHGRSGSIVHGSILHWKSSSTQSMMRIMRCGGLPSFFTVHSLKTCLILIATRICVIKKNYRESEETKYDAQRQDTCYQLTSGDMSRFDGLQRSLCLLQGWSGSLQLGLCHCLVSLAAKTHFFIHLKNIHAVPMVMRNLNTITAISNSCYTCMYVKKMYVTPSIYIQLKAILPRYRRQSSELFL